MDFQNLSREELIIYLKELRQENTILKALYDKDIIDRKLAEVISHETNEQLDNLFNFANSPIIVWNTQYEITRFNKAFESLTGRTEKDVINKSIEILFPPIDKDCSMELIKKTTEGELWEVVEINILHIDGSIHTLLWNSANIMSADKKTPIAIIAQGKDITKRIETEKKLKAKNKQIENQNENYIQINNELAFQNEEKEKRAAELIITNKELLQLLQLNEDKDRFMSILAHDLKSPFNSILGSLDLLSLNIREYDINKIEKLVNNANKSAQHVYHLLDDILMWVSAESGHLSYDPQNVSFKKIYLDLLEVLNPNATAKKITISCLSEDDILVFADIDMLSTILRNLVSNAIKFTNVGGIINVSVNKLEDLEMKKMDSAYSNYQIVSVSDTGVGISKNNMGKLFDLTQKYSTRGTLEEEGTGLGLIICKEFVEKHGGTIWAESESGKGSKFYFTLPEIAYSGK